MIDEITDIRQISALVVFGFTDWKKYGEVKVTQHEGLLIFNYTQLAQFAARWNYFERISRGLILDANTGTVVARPFEKFYNWGEGNRTTDADIVSITEKMDGSLGILYEQDGKLRIATRGSFTSEQAQWANKYLENKTGLASLNSYVWEFTFLFEIVYPDNRVVVDYAGVSGLYLLAIRHTDSGEYISLSTVQHMADRFGFPVPGVPNVNRIDELLALKSQIDANQEGWVVEFSDGQRFKFKGDRYMELHKLISGLSFKHTLETMQSGGVSEIRSQIPEEFLPEFDGWVKEIETVFNETTNAALQAFQNAPKETRKEFAIWTQTNHPALSSYLFALLDGRDITPLIYRQAFRERIVETPETDYLPTA